MATNASSKTDSGFAIRWTSVPASYAKPKAGFNICTAPSCPNIVYSGYKINYQNTSTGSNVLYKWDVNADGIFGKPYDSASVNPSWTFTSTTPVNKKVCL